MRPVSVLALTLGTWLAAASAHAGPLGDTVKGIDHAAGNTGPSNNSSGGSSTSAGDILGAVVNGFLDSSNWQTNPVTYTPGIAYNPYSPSGQGTTVEAYVGVQSVVGSNGAFTGEIRASYDDFALSLRGTAYFESPTDPMAPETRLDLGLLTGQARIAHDDASAAWVELGGAGVSDMNGTVLFGVAAGLRVEHRLGGELGVFGQAHYAILQQGVQAYELLLGARLSVLRASYRVVDFNVGPPLHGPEIGIALSF